MNRLRIAGVVQSEGLVQQVKAKNNIAARLVAFLLVALALNQVPGSGARAADPALPKLKTETQEAFDRYVKRVEARNEGELKRGTDLLWVDGLPEKQRAEAYAGLKSGEVRMQKLEILHNDKPMACPGGMIHQWTGAVFVPRAKLEDILSVLEDYDKHSVYYAPDVERSKIESRDGDHFRVFLRFHRKKVITIILNSEHDIHYFRDSAERAHSRSSTTHIAEVENPGKPNEREKSND